MKVLIACERSGAVRRAFRERGHDAWSCDLEEADDNSPYHFRGDAIHAAYDPHIPGVKGVTELWDLMIAHPPCTFLANSSNKHLYIGMTKEGGPNHKRFCDMVDGADFFYRLLNAPIARICIENPIMHGYAKTYVGRQQDQTIQPWQFWHLDQVGTGEMKATCLWLKNLSPLTATTPNETGRVQAAWKMGPSDTRQDDRSRTYRGIADAMAEQWGNSILDDMRSVKNEVDGWPQQQRTKGS